MRGSAKRADLSPPVWTGEKTAELSLAELVGKDVEGILWVYHVGRMQLHLSRL